MLLSEARSRSATLDGADVIQRARLDYLNDGACCLRGVVSPQWLAAISKGLDGIVAAPSPLSRMWTAGDGHGRFFQDVFAWRRMPELRQFALESGIASHVAALLNTTEIRLYGDHVFMRDAGTAKETPWHQDESYCFVSGQQFCSVWLPLDPVTRGECLQLVRGSHAWNTLYPPVEFGSKARYAGADAEAESVPTIERDSHDILAWEMQPGDCIVFSARTLHGASGEASKGVRRVYVTRWVGDDARFKRQAWSVPALPHDAGLQSGERFSGELFPPARLSADAQDP